MFITRRKFLTYSSAIGLSLAARQYLFAGNKPVSTKPAVAAGLHHPGMLPTDRPLTVNKTLQNPDPFIVELASEEDPGKKENIVPDQPVRHPADYLETTENSAWEFQDLDAHVVDNLIEVSRLPEQKTVPVDLILHDHEFAFMRSAVARLKRLQSFVGYANFNVIGWDQSLRFAKNYSNIGAFEKSELDFIEQIFFDEAERMGFYGEKVVTQISATIRRNDIKKIPASGHYLFKGDSLKTYEKIRRDIGDDIVLTSGIRGVVKQIYLFLRKASEVGGNLSTASYSLAPPGHSFHAVGDFDVGKANFGRRNFTAAFAATDEFKKLTDLGYIDIRYPLNNPFGVRYEPWHIKVV